MLKQKSYGEETEEMLKIKEDLNEKSRTMDII